MKRFILAVTATLALSLAPAVAADFQKGLAAAESGDYATAFKEWKPLAEAGDARAQTQLGKMYSSGRGVLQDYAQALIWYRLAAEQGDSEAQVNLGVMFANGYGVSQDDTQAVKWYQLSADQGFPLAQYFLGAAHALGQGVPQDFIIAHMWANISGANGDINGVDLRDAVRNKMTPSDISKAQQMARDCLGSGYKNCGY